jgi:hypothetical protein
MSTVTLQCGAKNVTATVPTVDPILFDVETENWKESSLKLVVDTETGPASCDINIEQVLAGEPMAERWFRLHQTSLDSPTKYSL